LTKDGNEIAMTENQFAFSVNESVSNGAVSTNTEFAPTMNADGNITLKEDKIPINNSGTYTYTAREIGTAPKGFTYDTNYYEITYIVSKGETALTASSPTIKQYDSEGNLLEGNVIKFSNKYSASGSGTVKLSKKLIGMDLTADQFSFTITQTNTDDTTPYTETMKNAADGTIPFSAIDYTKAGTYTYTIIENIPEDATPSITYDDKVIKVTMVVTDDGKGELTATPSYEGGQEFTNVFAPEDFNFNKPNPIKNSVIVNSKKTFTNDEVPSTGDESNSLLWMLLLAISGTILIGISLYRFKKHTNSKNR